MSRLCRAAIRFPFVCTFMACLLAFSVDAKDAGAQAKGYTIEYLDSWPVNNEIRYVRIVIAANSGAAADDLDFYVVAQKYGRQDGTLVSTVVPIRKGDPEAVGELYVPVSAGYNFSIHTELDGDLRRDRSDFAYRNYFDYQFANTTFEKSTPPMVLASSQVTSDESIKYQIMTRKNPAPISSSIATTDDFLSLDDLEVWYEATYVNVAGGKTYMNVNGFSSPGVAVMSLGALPSKWFGYEGLGVLVITFDDLKLLAKNHRGKLLAIERWVAASGRLAVLNCGRQFEHVNQVLQMLGDDNEALVNDRKCSFLSTSLDEVELETALDEARDQAQQNVGTYYEAMRISATPKYSKSGKINPSLERANLKSAKGKAKDFLAVDFELGQVVCISDSASNWSTQRPNNVDGWGPFGVFLEAISKYDTDRFLLNSDTVFEFGFPEFAEPPRYLFEFSILAYLFAVGPITYFVLKRKRKLNLMFVVVPLISSIFCSGILAWAILAEGFDTRVNEFTHTKLNQRSGRQVTSTMSHVYSGMTPSPYSLSASTYGFINLPISGRTQRIRWKDDGEELSGGEIRARTNHQLFTRCSNETTGKLVFQFQGKGESAIASVRNDFETTLSCVTFRSDECGPNECWFCEQVNPGAVSKAAKMKLADAAKQIRKEIRSRGTTTVYASGKKYSRSTNTRYVRYGSEISSADSTEVYGELRKAWQFAEAQLKSLFTKNEAAYFALTEESINYETAISDAKKESAIHILEGVR